VTFQAPPGYVQRASVGPFIQIWGKDKSVLTLIALPVKSDLHKSIQNSGFTGESKDDKEESITICDNQPAILVEGTGQVHNAGSNSQVPQRGHVEIVATEAAGKTFMALYVRPIDAAVDTSAEKAIHNLCPKP